MCVFFSSYFFCYLLSACLDSVLLTIVSVSVLGRCWLCDMNGLRIGGCFVGGDAVIVMFK